MALSVLVKVFGPGCWTRRCKCWPFGGKVNRYQAGRGGAAAKSRGLCVRRWMWRLNAEKGEVGLLGK